MTTHKQRPYTGAEETRVRAMQSVEMRKFRQLVFTCPGVREALGGHVSDQEFVSATVTLAEAFQIKLDADEVRQALDSGQREWLERWL